MRSLATFAAFLALATTSTQVRASSLDSIPPDQQAIDALEARGQQAQPKEQCFLYAELVHQMTELSIRQYAAGDVGKATGLLKHIQQIVQKIHLSLGDSDKRVKNTEILLDHTAFRLKEMLHASSFEDRSLVEQTLAQVTDAQNASMMQVFKK